MTDLGKATRECEAIFAIVVGRRSPEWDALT